MADTMFNIFGEHLANPVHRQMLRVKTDENNGKYIFLYHIIIVAQTLQMYKLNLFPVP